MIFVPVMSSSRSNVADAIFQPTPLRSTSAAAATKGDGERCPDDVQGNERCQRDRPKGGERSELLCDTDVA
jgi:hypothetical protein